MFEIFLASFNSFKELDWKVALDHCAALSHRAKKLRHIFIIFLHNEI